MRISALRGLHAETDPRGGRALPTWAGPLGYGIVALLVAGLLWFAIAQPVQVLPRIGDAPDFTLVDQDGGWLAASDLRGRLVFLSMGYSDCGERCAGQLARLNELAGRLGEQAIFLQISLDPERDTPERLQAFAAAQGLDESRWRLLTGRPGEIKALIGGELGIYYGRQETSAPITFKQQVLLIDQLGLKRALYDGASLDLARVERDLELLRREDRSSGLMRGVYEASHLFLCYPDP